MKLLNDNFYPRLLLWCVVSFKVFNGDLDVPCFVIFHLENTEAVIIIIPCMFWS